MATKRYTAEHIIFKLREAEVLLAKGIPVSRASKQIGVVGQTPGDEVLKREIFYTLEEAQIIIEMWRNG